MTGKGSGSGSESVSEGLFVITFWGGLVSKQQPPTLPDRLGEIRGMHGGNQRLFRWFSLALRGRWGYVLVGQRHP